jgi:phage gpG-like protein
MATQKFFNKNFFRDLVSDIVDEVDGTSYSRKLLVPLPGLTVAINGTKEFIEYISTQIEGKFLQIVRQELPILLDTAFNVNWPDTSSDLVDTGALRNSLEINITNGSLSIRYTAPYAGIVHYGGYIVPYGNKNAERVYIPPRPFLEYAINGGGPFPAYDFKDALDRAIAMI